MLRPEIELQPSAGDKILKSLIAYLAVVILLVNGLELYLNWHTAATGLLKFKMMLLSGFSILIAAGGHYITRYPQYFNYRKEINEHNAPATYKRSIHAIRVTLIIMLLVICVLSFINFFQSIQYLAHWERYYLLPVIVGLCLIFYTVIYFRSRKQEAV